MSNEAKKKVSVVVITYKQEEFIGQALESIVNQRTNFDIEVLVGEDCSPDNTAAVVREYADKYPDIIIPFIREKNMGMCANELDLTARATGEYLALLEGDDYWIDENKLQKQVDFMDSHPEYVACYSHCIVVNEKNERNEDREKYNLYLKSDGEYTAEDLECYWLPGQTGTSLFRMSAYNQVIEKCKEINFDWNKMTDINLTLLMLSVGKIHVFDDYFGAYRYMLSPESGSWSSKNDCYSIECLMKYLDGLKYMENLAKSVGLRLNFDSRRKYEWDKLMASLKSFRKEDIRRIKEALINDSNSKAGMKLHGIRHFIKRF